MASRFKAISIKPELEVFGPGDIIFGKHLADEGLLDANPVYQFVMGAKSCLRTDVLTMTSRWTNGERSLRPTWAARSIVPWLPEEVAAMAFFLASHAARHLTGQNIGMCGNVEWEA